MEEGEGQACVAFGGIWIPVKFFLKVVAGNLSLTILRLLSDICLRETAVPMLYRCCLGDVQKVGWGVDRDDYGQKNICRRIF